VFNYKALSYISYLIYVTVGEGEEEDIYCRPQDMTASYQDHADAYHDIRHKSSSNPLPPPPPPPHPTLPPQPHPQPHPNPFPPPPPPLNFRPTSRPKKTIKNRKYVEIF